MFNTVRVKNEKIVFDGQIAYLEGTHSYQGYLYGIFIVYDCRK